MSIENAYSIKPDGTLHLTGESLLPGLPDMRQHKVSLAPERSNVVDSAGSVNFSPIKGYDTVGSSAQAAPADTHEYIVKRGDNMWNIARNSLTHGDRHVKVDGEQVWQRIREIVDASKAIHPEIRANPFYIYKGEHLIIPGAAWTKPAANDDAPARGGRSPGRQSGADRGHAGADNDHRGPGGQPAQLDNGNLAHALKTEASHQARRIGTVGDCARGPRQTLEKFGVSLRPMSAVMQGEVLERSGMFDRVPANEVQPGDYGYRHWSAKTIARRGLGDLGDSFIVTNCNPRGMSAANDHMFTVPPGGGYYAKGITFLRPNAKFYAAYEHYKQTGEKTRLR